ncbi:origin recognition complex subunit 4-like isoform X2 [Stegodyphus dumicola]|uniref:origin recognition complex subunit 4-like isoform X2 n=1 Tax=Stegodyphus dumicola TaxID=202533 RepID=UPI0015A9CDB7|nr:origin recognition complex subunit 4-like isoform X2 [Stegodyphus dumicola]
MHLFCQHQIADKLKINLCHFVHLFFLLFIMLSDTLEELCLKLRYQLKPYGYCGHLLQLFESKVHHLEDMIKRTALMSESNSVLIIGPRGSGKSALLEHVISKSFESKLVKGNMLYVSLNGLIHTNDNLALTDIARQLKLNEIEDRPSGSFSEKLRILLSALKSGTQATKSVLFVLDNFDLFCTHKNQTLLYNLFDVAQSQQTPICVVGMCSRPDVLQILENRVNSRFSHQKILLFQEITFEEYFKAAKTFLCLKKFSDKKFLNKWNAEVDNLLKIPSVKNILERRFNCSNTMRDLKELLSLVVQNLKCSHPKLTTEDFERAYDQCCVDSKSDLLLGLSVLEITLITAMMHLTNIYDGEPFNFEIVYNEVNKYLSKTSWNSEKPVAMKAFEHLLELELVKPCHDSSSDVLKRFMPVRLLVDVDQVKETVEKYQNLPVSLKRWIESSIDV